MATAPQTQQRAWEGLPVSSGVAHAAVHVWRDHFDEPEQVKITPGQVEAELAKMRSLVKRQGIQLEQ